MSESELKAMIKKFVKLPIRFSAICDEDGSLVVANLPEKINRVALAARVASIFTLSEKIELNSDFQNLEYHQIKYNDGTIVLMPIGKKNNKYVLMVCTEKAMSEETLQIIREFTVQLSSILAKIESNKD